MSGFNPAMFQPAPVRSIVLGNSQHPVMDIVEHHSFKRIPSKHLRYEGVFYVVLKNDKGIFTYMGGHVPTIQYHPITLTELKALVKADKPLPNVSEVIDVRDEKYIGNTVLDEFQYIE